MPRIYIRIYIFFFNKLCTVSNCHKVENCGGKLEIIYTKLLFKMLTTVIFTSKNQSSKLLIYFLSALSSQSLAHTMVNPHKFLAISTHFRKPAPLLLKKFWRPLQHENAAIGYLADLYGNILHQEQSKVNVLHRALNRNVLGINWKLWVYDF